MRIVKRALLFVVEVGVLVIGFVASSALAGYFESAESNLAAIAFFLGLLLTIVCFAIVRRKTRRWKIQYDADGWLLR